MPQLAPTLGYLIFFFILVAFILLVISNSKTLTPPSTRIVTKSRNGPLFF
nr:ATP synthase F0 subunit 8 [Onchidium reevesii]UZH97733.1 ATP synthase F0 subunit 8 [Onchidium reevesii]